jgi:membrane associated rhomboid family serine protease
MLPYGTSDTDEPTRVFPWVTIGLILVNFLVFFYELALGAQGQATQNRFFLDYALVPCEYTRHCVPYPGTPSPFWLTLFTSMFMHAGWAHILGNMLFLGVFGPHVENAMGRLRYLAFYFICGLAANGLEIAFAATSHVPGLGASGAIAGVLGAFLLLFPTSSVRAVLPLTILLIPMRLPAWVMIGGWFLLQLFDGLASLSPGSASSASGVAYWAHVGGFLMGLLLVWVFQQPQRVAQTRAYLAQARP